MKYRIYEVEEVISEMDLSEVEDDIAETDEDMQLVISGWYVNIPELNLNLREGVVCIWDEEEKLFMPDFAVTVIYEGDIEGKDWIYYEQDGFVVTLANWLNGRLPVEQIEQLRCELVIPQQDVVTNNNLIKGREEWHMKYSIKVNSINSKEGSNIKGFATVVFGDSFKITNIAILENKDKDQLFVSMPRYKSTEREENGATIYKDVCNPITAEFREELYTNILEAYERVIAQEQEQAQDSGKGTKSAVEMPEFSVTVTPYERDGSNIRGLARIYIEESFIVNNVNILQGKENIFVTMPAYKTKQMDEQGKPIYQDVCYPVTREFREKLYTEIVREYEQAKEKNQNQAKNIEVKPVGSRVNQQEKEATPFR